MSFRKNVLTSYAGQIYVALIGIAMVPVYVRFMGTEAYGLVAFFAMLQTWLQLLDLGLTPTFSRELSRYRAGAVERMPAAAMVRSMEWICGSVGVGCVLLLAAAAPWIASHWLKLQDLDRREVAWCVAMMGAMIGLRSPATLYRGGLAGLELLPVLNLANVAVATLRAVGVVAVLALWTTRPAGFFLYQLFVTVVELVLMNALFYRAFPMTGTKFRPDFAALRNLLRLAGSMALLVALWVVISQADKLVFSWSLDLKSYASFMIAATLAGGITLLAAPVYQALQPRLAVLVAREEHAQVIALYRTSTQVVSAVLFAIAGVMGCFAEPLLLVWTTNADLAREGARILPLYAIGNAFAALLGLAFLVQFAYGKLRWHVMGNCLFGILWIPGVLVAAQHGGAVSAGWIWLVGNLVFLVCWVPFVQHRLLPGLGWRWLVLDVGAVALIVLGGLAVVRFAGLPGGGRWSVLAALAIVTLALALAGMAAGPGAREVLKRFGQGLFRPRSV
ncbi:MAG TPA: oligosaccharide flippase family protein [Opitutaceae bacterium]|nr:oligosaccharide flippase family protein [Opitutaceae bacterium]